jgi:hypothetical protein
MPSTTAFTDTVELRCPAGTTAVHCLLLMHDTLVARFAPK